MAEDITTARPIVEAAIKKLGLDPAAILTKEGTEQVAWTLKRGSAAVLVALILRPAGLALRVVSPTVIFDPSKKEAVFTRILELNADGMQGCAFGLVADKVVVVMERPTKDLDEGEVEYAMRHVAAISDTYDDRLVAEFGGKRASDA